MKTEVREGWVARDKGDLADLLCFYIERPVNVSKNGITWGENSGELPTMLPGNLFPKLRPKDGPKKCKLTIEFTKVNQCRKITETGRTKIKRCLYKAIGKVSE